MDISNLVSRGLGGIQSRQAAPQNSCLTTILLYEIAEWFLERVFEIGVQPGSLFLFTQGAVSVE